MTPVGVGRIRIVPVFLLQVALGQQKKRVREGGSYGKDTDFALLGFNTVLVSLWVHPNVGEALLGPTNSSPVQVCVPASLHLVPDNGDVFRVSPGVLVEAGDGEEEILEGV